MYDDGTGPALYVAGDFLTLGGSLVQGIAKFDGQQWVSLGGGVRAELQTTFVSPEPVGVVHEMAVFDLDGAGPNRPVLVVAGKFKSVDGSQVPSQSLAAWDGHQWMDLSNGLEKSVPESNSPPEVFALAVYDSGSGPRLYAGGDFAVASGSLFGMAQWDGTSWVSVGGNGLTLLGGFGPPHGRVNHLMTFNDGTGTALYASGYFNGFIEVPGTKGIARWDGSTWSSVGGGRPGEFEIYRTVPFDSDGPGGAGPQLHAVGGSLHRWSGSAWTNVGAIPEGSSGSCFGGETGATVFDDGSGGGPALFIGGNGSCLGLTQVHLVKYNGSTFSVLGSDVFGGIATDDSRLMWIGHLAAYNLGGTNRLLAGGFFAGTHDAPMSGMMEWNGSDWTTFGSFGGLTSDPSTFAAGYGVVGQLLSFDPDGTGPSPASLVVSGVYNYIGGTFHANPSPGYAGGALVVRNDSSWTDFGAPFPVTGFVGKNYWVDRRPTGDQMYVIAQSNEPDPVTGGTLYAGGVFRYSGTNWVPVGGNMGIQGPPTYPSYIQALVTADVGSGTRPYIFGAFQTIDGNPIHAAAQWNGSAWVTVGTVPDFKPGYSFYGISYAIAFDDGSGNALYAVSQFVDGRIMKWNGTTWSSASLGLPPPQTLDCQVYDPEPQLFVLAGSLYAWRAGYIETDNIFCNGPYAIDGTLYRWNPETGWVLVGSPDTGYVNISLIGVADPGVGERAYFSSQTTNMTIVDIPYTVDRQAVIEFDGTTFTPNPDLGRFVNSPPSAVRSVPESDGSTSLWFGGGFVGVGAANTGAGYGAFNGISSKGLARYAACPLTCPSDFDGDGFVTGDDFDGYVAAFELGEISSDFNRDGFVTGDDFDAYVIAFEAGC